MRLCWSIAWVLFLVACTQPHNDLVETRFIASPKNTASPKLSAIDSLMWYQPDSALMCLLPYFDTCCRDALNASPDNVLNASPDNVLNASPDNTTDTTRRNHCVSTTAYNRHYAHLLLSELLYKNDYAQTNRTELQQAVAYFDSLMLADTRGVSLQVGRCRDTSNVSVRRRASAKNATKTNIFLDARAHYINGVGYYENDSVIQACAEYLKTLEIMENHFEEKEIVENKARFVSLIYGHLGELFKEELLIDPAIECFKEALNFCNLEPTSKYGKSISLYRLGILFNITGQNDSADFYYRKALENLPDKNNLHYRDIITSKTILDYNSGRNIDSVIKELRFVESLATDESERLSRFLIIGDIFYEDKMYDSARWFLESVFEQQSDIQARMLAAEELRNIYQEERDSIKAHQYAAFLANLAMPEYERKTDVSKLNELFQNYLIQKQGQKAAWEKHKAVLRTVKILVPIALVIAFVIVVTIRRKSKRNLARQKAEAQREIDKRAKQHEKALEAEQQAHRMEQAALSGRLKRSNEKLHDVSKQLEETLAKNSLIESETSNDYSAYINTPICLYIINLVHKQQFKSKMDYLIYKESALSKEQLLALRSAAEKHLMQFVSQIRKQFPKLTDNDMDYCYLFLLGLNEADISALIQRAYTTVCDRSRKISRIIGDNNSLYQALRNMLHEN